MAHLHIFFCGPYASNPIHVCPSLQYDVDCDSGIFGDGSESSGSTNCPRSLESSASSLVEYSKRGRGESWPVWRLVEGEIIEDGEKR